MEQVNKLWESELGGLMAYIEFEEDTEFTAQEKRAVIKQLAKQMIVSSNQIRNRREIHSYLTGKSSGPNQRFDKLLKQHRFYFHKILSTTSQREFKTLLAHILSPTNPYLPLLKSFVDSKITLFQKGLIPKIPEKFATIYFEVYFDLKKVLDSFVL